MSLIKRSPADNNCKTKKIAVELTEPGCLEGGITHANFMCSSELKESGFIYYVRNERKKFFRKSSKPKLNDSIVFAGNLPLKLATIMKMCCLFLHLLIQQCRTGYSIYSWRRFFSYLGLYSDLSALFENYSVSLHFYNTFPNADKIATRIDSGVVTGVCRSHAVISASYQTRTFYTSMYHYFYDSFDIFFVWGDFWKRFLGKAHYVREFIPVGNLSLSKTVYHQPSTHHGFPKRIMLFDSDIVSHFPQHYTREYCLEFLKIILEAFSRVPPEKYELYYKPKNIQLADEILADPTLIDLQKKCTKPVRILRHGKHNIWDAIAKSDLVLSIGFTTPGLCAISAGKKSYYITPYKYEYNELFAPGSGFIIHSTRKLLELLSSTVTVSPSLVNDLDYKCDGLAQERLINLSRERIQG